jgi:type VII secretion-associated serine protease mycosin
MGMCGFLPGGALPHSDAHLTASTHTISTHTASTRTVSTHTAAGRTDLADNGTCTKSEGSLLEDQGATPWEISYANTQSSSQYGDGSGVKVAVIDTGIEGGDSQLSGAISGGQDFTDSGGVYKADVDGHGTFVASIIAAQKTSRNGMVGLAPGVKLLIYREAGCNVKAGNDEKTMASAINAAVAANARVINISQAGYVPDDTLKAAVMNAYRNNVLIVVAAGNAGNKDATDPNSNADYGINPTTYPAAYVPYLLAVGAANQDGGVAGFSETGPFISVTAPGAGVGGLFPDGKVHVDDGTSFAAPYVSAIAALLIARHPDWSVSTLIRVLESTASGNGSWNSSQGWGEVDATAALNADPNNLAGLYGAGPNADGPAQARPVTHGIPMLPIVNAAPAQAVVTQRKGAYIALGAAILIVIVAAAGTAIARDARRRRMTP